VIGKGPPTKGRERMIETASFEEVTQIRMSREIDGEHAFAALSNGQYTTENLVRSVLKMEE